jgi:hypothetical protein
MANSNIISILIQAKDSASNQLSAVSREVDAVGAASEEAAPKTAGMASETDNLSAKVRNLGQFFASAAIVTTITNLGAAAFSAAGQLEQTNVSFQNLIGNTALANSIFAQLTTYAFSTPFQAADVEGSAKQLLAFGEDAQSVVGTVKQLGDVAAAGGGDLQALSLVTGQVFSQGKLRAQDMYQVINDGGAGLIKIMAANAGGMQNLTNEFETGGIPAQQYFDAINQATANGGFAFEGAQKQAATFNGQLSNLEDAAEQFGMKLLGVHLDPQLGLVIDKGGLFDRAKGLINAATKALTELGDNKVAVEAIAGAIGGLLLGAIVAVVLAIGWIPLAIAAAAMVFGAVVAVIATHLSDIAAFFKRIWSDISGFFQQIWYGEILHAYYVVLNNIEIGLIQIQAFFNNTWTSIYNFFAGTMSRTYAFFFNTWQSIKAAFAAVMTTLYTDIVRPVFDALKQPLLDFLGVNEYILDVIRGAWLVEWWFVYRNVIQPVMTAITTTVRFAGQVIATVWEFMRSTAVAAWQAIYRDVIQPQVNAIVTAVQWMGSVVAAVWNAIAGAASATWGWIMSTVIQPQVNAIVTAVQWMGSVITSVWSAIASAASATWDAISGVAGSVWDKLTGGASSAASSVQGIFSGVASAIKDVFKDSLNWIIDRLNDLINAVNATAGRLPGVPKIADISKFATGTNFAPGGLAVVGEQGPELVNLPRGSQVIPNRQSSKMLGGGRAVNVTVNAYNNVDVNALIRRIGFRLATA